MAINKWPWWYANKALFTKSRLGPKQLSLLTVWAPVLAPMWTWYPDGVVFLKGCMYLHYNWFMTEDMRNRLRQTLAPFAHYNLRSSQSLIPSSWWIAVFYSHFFVTFQIWISSQWQNSIKGKKWQLAESQTWLGNWAPTHNYPLVSSFYVARLVLGTLYVLSHLRLMIIPWMEVVLSSF